jgi:hypothetical protein
MLEITNETLNHMREKQGSKNYIKNPILIEAFQIHEDFYVDTLEGRMKASSGDYVIIGIEKEIYPCKKEIFEKSYAEI